MKDRKISTAAETVLGAVNQAAERYPWRRALLFKPGFLTRSWSHRTLADLVTRAARHYSDSGISPGDRVIVWAANRPEWALSFLALLHVGAVPVLLDTRLDQESVLAVFTASQAKAVAASKQTAATARKLDLPVHLNETLPELARACEPLPAHLAGPTDPAVIVLAGSGTQLALTHRQLLAEARSAWSSRPLTSRDRLLSVLPLSHPFELAAGLIAPLTVGAAVAYPASRWPSGVLRAFRDFRATKMVLVPEAIRLLDDTIERRIDRSGIRERFEGRHRLARRVPMRLRRLLFTTVRRRFGGRLRDVLSYGSTVDPTLVRRWSNMGIAIRPLADPAALALHPAPEWLVDGWDRAVARGAIDAPRSGIFGWQLHPIVRGVGLLAQEVLLQPAVKILYRRRISGREKLRDLSGPVLFAPNHCLHWDNGILLLAIPRGWRWKLAIAGAADEMFGNRLRGTLLAALTGAFPLAREGAIRRSLEVLGSRLDRDFSVMIYPEGKLTVGGPTQPFKTGTGLIAVDGATPVVPMRLKVRQMSIVDRIGWPLRGDVEVVFGDPIYFANDTDPQVATGRLEAAIAAL